MSRARTLALASAVAVASAVVLWTRPSRDPAPEGREVNASVVAFPALAFAEAFRQLDSALTPGQRDTLRRTLPDSVARYHFSVGLFVRNEVLLGPHGPVLEEYLVQRGVRSRDARSSAFLDLYGQYLRGQPLDVEGVLGRLPPDPQGFKVLSDSGLT